MLVQELFAPGLFAGRTVFVTGGGSGINLGIARNFAALGAHIGLCGRTASRLEAAAESLRAGAAPGARVCAVVADVRDHDALAAAFARSEAELGPMDVLVCGAAGNFLAPAERLSANGFRSVVDIDLNGSFNAAHAAFDQLRRTRGSLIFVSAGMGYVPHAFQVHAGAAKAGIEMLARNLALEWGRYGIRANTIVPGPIAGTEGMARLGGTRAAEAAAAPLQADRDRDDRRPDGLPAVPLGRLGSVDDIGQAAVFLASPLASWITGTRLVCDGGQNLAGSTLFNQGAAQALAAQAAVPRA